MRFIRERCAEDISLSDIAASANTSPYYFSTKFKKDFGYSPHKLFMLTRINAAKQLLKTTNLTIKAIAGSVGYPNTNALTYAFSTRVGISPTAFPRYPV